MSGRVLFVAPIPPPVHGGALAMQYLLSLKEQTGLRHINSQFAAGLADMGRFSVVKAWRLLCYCCQLIQEVIRFRPVAVVVTPTFYLGPFLKDAVFIWLSFLLGRQTVAWLHMDFRMMGYEDRPALVRWFVRTTLLRCCRFVVVSEGLKAHLPPWIPSDWIDAVANGVEAPTPVPPRRLPDGKIRIVYLSNLEAAKGWRVMLEAVRELCVEFPEVEVVYHGRPAFKETDQSIGEEIARNDASGRITYAGPVYGEAKWKALAEADIFCFPSFHEAFPMAVLEARATGLPIVATRVGAVADAVQDGSGGELVPPGDIREMASALRRLIINPRLRREFGAFNQERFQEKYTLLAYQQRWLAWMQRCS